MLFTYKPVDNRLFSWKDMPIDGEWMTVKQGVWMHTDYGEHLQLLKIRRESQVRWALAVDGNTTGSPNRIKDLDSGCGCGLHLPDLLERLI